MAGSRKKARTMSSSPVAAVAAAESRTVTFNVGGTKYEVSQSLLDRFHESMLRRISFDTWKETATASSMDGIVIDRNEARIDFVQENITLSVADPNDLFYGLAAYRNHFKEKSMDIDKRYRKVAAEKLACAIATECFSQLIHTQEEGEQKPSPTYGGYPYPSSLSYASSRQKMSS
eukprot:scaffold58531_cov58-Attheya_sp.AAC.1